MLTLLSSDILTPIPKPDTKRWATAKKYLGIAFLACWVLLAGVGCAVMLSGCGSIDLNVRSGPPPEPSGLLEVRATAETRGTVALYVGGELELPIYTVEGKFDAIARASIPPSIDIYLQGDAYIVREPEMGAHERAVAEGRVRIYRDGVLLNAPQMYQPLAGYPAPAPAGWVPEAWDVVPTAVSPEAECTDGSCAVPVR